MKGCLLNEDLKMLWLTVTSNLDLGSLVGLIVIHLLLSLNPWLIDDIWSVGVCFAFVTSVNVNLID